MTGYFRASLGDAAADLLAEASEVLPIVGTALEAVAAGVGVITVEISLGCRTGERGTVVTFDDRKRDAILFCFDPEEG